MSIHARLDRISQRNSVEEFIRESNRIEGILRDPTDAEVTAHITFMNLEAVTISDLSAFVSVYQPNARLRDRAGLNVRVGGHIPPPGGPEIIERLQEILEAAHTGATPHAVHCAYETLHPFTDGNGRSGRMLWLWHMRSAPLGFLHTFYYQTLAALTERKT